MPHSCHSLGPFMGGMTETWKPSRLRSLGDDVNFKLLELLVFNSRRLFDFLREVTSPDASALGLHVHTQVHECLSMLTRVFHLSH